MFAEKNVTLITAPHLLEHLTPTPGEVVMLNSDLGPLDSQQEEALCTFVEQGGGLVCIGDVAEAYHEYDLLGDVLGNIHGTCTPRSEIIARVVNPDHYMTRRVDPSFAVLEAVYLLARVPPDAEILWRTSWRYTPYTLAYTRNYGRGRVFCTTLGSQPETQAHPVFRQMVARAVRYVSGVETQEHPARVAMIGYGVIGFEHGTAISNVPGLEYALICDHNEERLAVARQAFPGAHTCTDLEQVAEDPAIDLVIVSTPPNTHASISMKMLRAGKHVVSEKPFCLTTAEADEMIELAGEQQRALTVYQCRRWDPDFLAIQQVLRRDTIGAVFHMETFIGGGPPPRFPLVFFCSRLSGGVFCLAALVTCPVAHPLL